MTPQTGQIPFNNNNTFPPGQTVNNFSAPIVNNPAPPANNVAPAPVVNNVVAQPQVSGNPPQPGVLVQGVQAAPPVAPQVLGIQDVGPAPEIAAEVPAALPEVGGIAEAPPAPIVAGIQSAPAVQTLPVRVNQIPSTGGVDPTPVAVGLSILAGMGLWLRSRGRSEEDERTE
jgi:hypothetical protein